MAQILGIPARRLLLRSQSGVVGASGHITEGLGSGSNTGRRNKSIAPPIGVAATQGSDERIPVTVLKRKKDQLDLNFEDHRAAFKSKSTWEVIRALMVFQLCGINVLVSNNEMLMKIGKKVLGERLFGALMKPTFYGQFVAGENTRTIAPVIENMRSFGVKSILDYSAEEDISQDQAEEMEMDSCISHASTDEPQTNFAGLNTINRDKDFKRELNRYQPQREFGDRRKGVTGARTYFYAGEAACEKNMETFLRCIEAVATTTHTTGFAAIKITALGRPQLLLQLSEVIARARKYHQEVTGEKGTVIEAHVNKETFKQDLLEAGVEIEKPAVQNFLEHMTADQKGIINLFDWKSLLDVKMDTHLQVDYDRLKNQTIKSAMQETFQVPNLKTGRMEPLISALTEEEEEQFRNCIRRMNTVFQAAKELDVRCMVDAEQTYFQPAIARIAMEMMKKYNTEKAIVFNTYQCYLKDAYKMLVLDLEQANRENFYFGAKLVRGAYMEQERERASALNYPDPINENFDATTAMYHKCLIECMSRMKYLKDQDKPKKVGIMVASHNEDTVRFAIEKMKQLDIKPEDKVICFGQLLGMCDQLSFPLGQAGYSVYKYVPYGPVNEVLPYLSRRARENGDILTKLQKEKMLLRRELGERIMNGRLFYKPKGDYTPV